MSMISFAVLVALTSTSRPAAQAVPSPDFEFFKSRVEPIFLKKRPGHARWYFCHVVGSGANAADTVFHLEKLSPGLSPTARNRQRYRLRSPAACLPLPACPQPRPTAAPFLPHPSARRQPGTERSAGKENRAFSPAPLRSWRGLPPGDSERDRR